MKKNYFILLTVLSLTVMSCKKSGTDEVFPTVGLVSYFRFDDNLEDEEGITPDGAATGSPSFVTGKSNKAISFNGVDQKVVFDKKSFKSGNAVSIAFWFKTKQTGALNFFIGCSDFLVGNNNPKVSLAISIPGTESAYGEYTADEWTHYAGIYDGTDIKVFINGVLAETINHPGTIDDMNEKLFIGSRGGSVFWEGSIDDLFIYSKALSPTEITQLYNLHL
ncbi:MAG: LamG domain-containing protein [Sphingobacteriales bacterium]|nr:LamG domain-containing protein [Sphingobacteriales bacterium]